MIFTGKTLKGDLVTGYYIRQGNTEYIFPEKAEGWDAAIQVTDVQVIVRNEIRPFGVSINLAQKALESFFHPYESKYPSSTTEYKITLKFSNEED